MDDLDDDMPQPLSKVNPKAQVRLEVGTYPPVLCVQVTRVISAWAHIDQILTNMLASFLHADFDVVAAMYRALSSSDAKRAAIIGAAKQARPEQSNLLQAVLNAAKPFRGVRNKFAHHIWATSPELPDALILVDPAVMFERSLEYHKLARAGALEHKATLVAPGVFRLEQPQEPKHDRSRMFVWKEKDLTNAAEDADGCVTVFELLSEACGHQPRAEAQQELLTVPQVRQEFERLTTGSAQ